MPPKRNTRAAPAAAAVAVGTGEAPTESATAADRAAQRVVREEPAEEQRVVRPRQEVLEESKWKWDSLVRTVLLHQFNMDIEKMGLREFVREYVRRDYPIEQIDNYTMDVVVEELEECVTDGELRRRIEGREAFQQLRNTRQARQQAMKDADILEERGIVSLRQWKNTVDRDALNISAFTKGILDNAISVAEQTDNLRQLQEELHYREQLHLQRDEAYRINEEARPLLRVNITIPDGFYDSVCNASWNYVVKSRESSEEKFWMEVKEDNVPPSLEWTDGEVDFSPPVAGREVPWDEFEVKERHRKEARKREHKENENNAEPTQERLMMKVLTSPKNWPYGLYKKDNIFDCFVTKEVERAWRVVRGDLRAWFEADPRVLKKPRQRVLIGTPGIGKSMGVGSYLLHQLLQYDTEKLPVVAYFISKKTYIFNKITKRVTLYDDVMGLAIVEQLADNYNGYTIYDCSKRVGEPPVDLPGSWGTVVISSPNENNFKEWAKQKPATNFIINCPEESDIKAMCAWMKRDNPEVLHDYWSSIKNRMSTVGPIPRFIFDDVSYGSRSVAVGISLSMIKPETVEKYFTVGNDGLWLGDGPSHKIVKITRLAFDNGVEIFLNELICPEVQKKLRENVGNRIDNNAILMAVLLPLDVMIPRVLELLAVEAFLNKNFIVRVRNNINALPPPKVCPPRRCVLQSNTFACPTKSTGIPTVDILNNNKMEIQYNTLYRPADPNFPVVDGFFFVEQPIKIFIGIQVTVREDHDTTTSKVMALRECLRVIFTDWDGFSTDLSWEIIYVQHKDSKPMTARQKCKMQVPNCNRGDYDRIKKECKDIAKHWDEEVLQYQLKISSEDFHDNN